MGKISRPRFTRHFCNRLNKLLDDYHYTHKELADRSGVALRTIDAYCVGNCAPSLYNAYKMAKAFGISIDRFIYGYLD